MKFWRLCSGVFLVSLTALMLELILVRVFDVLFNPVSSYLTVSCAIYSLGLSGLYVYLKYNGKAYDVNSHITRITQIFPITILLAYVIVNALALLYRAFPENYYIQAFSYVGVYVCISIPFVVVGLVLSLVFLEFHDSFHILYFFDLIGASIGCIIFLPVLPVIGPGGLFFVAAALGVWASGLFSGFELKWMLASLLTGVVLIGIPFSLPENSLDFKGFYDKRGTLQAHDIGAVEKVIWDPISKVEVINVRRAETGLRKKHLAYDGGNQSSHIYPFDGDYEKLKKDIPDFVNRHFWQRGVLASHYIKEGESPDVLIIGSAGGQETKAALLYGAKKVDAVELVSAVVNLGKKDYADYNGNIFNDPRVNTHAGEGRAHLRKSNRTYDIIQIFSNHTSSSIAAGTGLISPVYLQTVEAYTEYYAHLSSDGILHINHHVFPRMVTTAAKAWAMSGRSDFQKHVVIFERNSEKGRDTIPTMLIKMTPWSMLEVEKLKAFYSAPSDEYGSYSLVANPIETESSGNFLSKDFFAGALPRHLEEKVPYNVFPPTDDRPFFNFFRKDLSKIVAEAGNYYRSSTTGVIGNARFGFVPEDLKSLFLMLLVSISVGSLIFFLPLCFSRSIDRLSFSETTYFCLIGLGFITYEFVSIQMFMKVIGNPIYSFSTVIFTFLLSSGLGSLTSSAIASRVKFYSRVPFIAILILSLLLWTSYEAIFTTLLGMEIEYRVFLSSMILFPFGFFLGMPMPLGMKALSKQYSYKIPWAWALNGFFTVFGGFLAIMCSLVIGFKATYLLACMYYSLALVSFSMIQKRHNPFDE